MIPTYLQNAREPEPVEFAKHKAPPETRRILQLAQIIGSDGLLPKGVERVEITPHRIVLIRAANG